MGQDPNRYDFLRRRHARGTERSVTSEVELTFTEAVPETAQRNRRAFWGVMAAFLVHGLVVSTWVSRIATMKAAIHLGDGTLGLALLGVAIGSLTGIPASGA